MTSFGAIFFPTCRVNWTAACIITLLLISLKPATAEPNLSSHTLIIGNDRGGTLRARISEIQRISRTGQRVAVTGRICYSTCTMFLGLPQMCVSPDTIFGFHGPSSYGRPLDPEVFERASNIIADHYPDVLKDWYMTTARHSLTGLYRVSGKELIRLGVAAC